MATQRLPPPAVAPQRFYQKYVEREIINHRLLAHPHIVGFKEVFVTAKARRGGRRGGGARQGAAGRRRHRGAELVGCAAGSSGPVSTCLPNLLA